MRRTLTVIVIHLNKIGNNTNYDLYILTDIDIPWEKDDLRDRPNDRKSMFNYYRDELVKNNLNFFLVSGSKEARLRKSILKIDKFISLNKNRVKFTKRGAITS